MSSIANKRIRFHEPTSDGIVPVNSFDPTSNRSIFFDHGCTISAGIVPVSELWCMVKSTRLSHRINVDGNVPEISFFDKSMLVNSVSKAMLGWIGPTILFMGNVIFVIV